VRSTVPVGGGRCSVALEDEKPCDITADFRTGSLSTIGLWGQRCRSKAGAGGRVLPSSTTTTWGSHPRTARNQVFRAKTFLPRDARGLCESAGWRPMNRVGRSVPGQAKAVLKHAQSRRWRAVQSPGACATRQTDRSLRRLRLRRRRDSVDSAAVCPPGLRCRTAYRRAAHRRTGSWEAPFRFCACIGTMNR
jgi:hypothetical protein